MIVRNSVQAPRDEDDIVSIELLDSSFESQSFMASKCPLCKSGKVKFVRLVKDSNHFLPGYWDLYRCFSCNLHYLANAPDSEEMSKYYPVQEYYTHNLPPRDGRLMSMVYDYHYGCDKSFIAGVAYLLLRGSINMFPPKGGPNSNYLLDVGCGNGQLIQRFERYGFACEGYDVDENALHAAQTVAEKTYSGDFYSLALDRKFFVVIMNQVLEHLHDPQKMLGRIKDLLLEDGRLIISVPNSRCADFYLLKDSWTAFQAPTHIFHFNLDSLSRLLAEAGFEVEKATFSSRFGGLKPYYLKKNVRNLFRIEKSAVVASLKSALFLLSSILTLLPFLSRYGYRRLTVYCKPI